MNDPYTIRIFVPDGDPEGAKVVELMNWTGVGVAFPRAKWGELKGRSEFKKSGVYILIGAAEGTDDELPTVYIGQGDEIGLRLSDHFIKKEFWDWGYGFVSKANDLNRAHITWLEHSLIRQAKLANRCHLDNGNEPQEPTLSESDRADTVGFMREMLRILPLLGVRVFEKARPVVTPGKLSFSTPNVATTDLRDTLVVPAQEPGFTETFLGENSWYAVRIGGGMLEKIKYIAAYQSAPVSAITHTAKVDRIEQYGDDGKYRLFFAEPAKPLPKSIPLADAPAWSIRSPRYASLAKLQSAKSISELFPQQKPGSLG